MKIARGRLFAILFLPIALQLACGGGKAATRPPEAAPVTAGLVERKDVSLEVRAIGHAEAFSTVSVRARVGGELKEAHFREGQDVPKGALLFSIDPRSYEVALRQAEADLQRDRVKAQVAREFERRYAELVKKEFVTRDQYDQARAAADALEATLKADEAVVENARLSLSYCSIASPIDGRTGSLLVNVGNVIKANDDRPLVVLNQVRPIRVSFNVPEQVFGDVRTRLAAGALKATAFPRGADPASGVAGTLTFIDNTVDPATGTLVLKAVFPNQDGKLWPGQFVDVDLTLGAETGALVVPLEAVQTGQRGSYLYVIKADGTVEQRPIIVKRTAGGLAVLAEGVSPGERVVTDGQLRLTPGAKVEIRQGGKTS